MKIVSLYKDFFNMLEGWNQLSDQEKLKRFNKFYFKPNFEFLSFYYYQYLRLEQNTLNERIVDIREDHYSQVRELSESENLEFKITSIIKQCEKIILINEPINIFLNIGFFSPEGFCSKIQDIGKKNIIIGLERFKSLDNIDMIITHEYGHCLFELKEIETMYEKILREGMAFLFSKMIFKKRPLEKILFMKPDDIRITEEKIFEIKQLFLSGKLTTEEIFKYKHTPYPKRFGNLISYEFVSNIMKNNTLEEIINIKNPKQLFLNWCKS